MKLYLIEKSDWRASGLSDRQVCRVGCNWLTFHHAGNEMNCQNVFFFPLLGEDNYEIATERGMIIAKEISDFEQDKENRSPEYRRYKDNIRQSREISGKRIATISKVRGGFFVCINFWQGIETAGEFGELPNPGQVMETFETENSARLWAAKFGPLDSIGLTREVDWRA